MRRLLQMLNWKGGRYKQFVTYLWHRFDIFLAGLSKNDKCCILLMKDHGAIMDE
jgi:hypothetical protein